MPQILKWSPFVVRNKIKNGYEHLRKQFILVGRTDLPGYEISNNPYNGLSNEELDAIANWYENGMRFLIEHFNTHFRFS